MMYKCKKRHSKLKTQPYQINSVFGHEITIFFLNTKIFFIFADEITNYKPCSRTNNNI